MTFKVPNFNKAGTGNYVEESCDATAAMPAQSEYPM
jgi:hypothetical protein